MKRMESSVYSFNLTLERIKKLIDSTIDTINRFNHHTCTTLNLTDNNNLTEDYEFGPIETLLDNIIEKTDKYLDISKGVRTDDKNKVFLFLTMEE